HSLRCSSAPSVCYTLSLHDALPICQAHDALHVGDKTHVEHPVRFIQHQELDAVEPHVTAVGEIEQAARCRHQDVDDGALQHFLLDRKSTRLNSSHVKISYAVFCLKK